MLPLSSSQLAQSDLYNADFFIAIALLFLFLFYYLSRIPEDAAIIIYP